MKINLPAGRDLHHMEEMVGDEYLLEGESVGEIVGHIDTGMNSYLTVDVSDEDTLTRITEKYDIYARPER